MNAKRALKWAVGYRAVATLSFAVGLAIAGVGGWVWILGPLLDAVLGPSSVTTGLLVDAVPGLLLVALGVIVWQTGSTVGFYYTLVAATGQEAGESVDTEKIKSDVLAVLDERLAEMHEDVEATRRAVGADSPSAGGATTGGTRTARSPAKGEAEPAGDGADPGSEDGGGHPASPDDRNGA